MVETAPVNAHATCTRSDIPPHPHPLSLPELSQMLTLTPWEVWGLLYMGSIIRIKQGAQFLIFYIILYYSRYLFGLRASNLEREI
jgi:hypothetical protein